MNWFIRGLLQPTENRYYMGRRLHILRFAFGFFPLALVCVVAFFFTFNALWLLGLTVTLVYGLIVYHTYDKVTDRMLWDKFYKRHYSAPKKPPGYEAMKAFENDPSPKNKITLSKALKEE